MTQTLKDFKRNHKLFFKNGNINGFPESYRVWRNHLIVFDYPDSMTYWGRVWRENSAGALIPASNKIHFSHLAGTFETAVANMRKVTDIAIVDKYSI